MRKVIIIAAEAETSWLLVPSVGQGLKTLDITSSIIWLEPLCFTPKPQKTRTLSGSDIPTLEYVFISAGGAHYTPSRGAG